MWKTSLWDLLFTTSLTFPKIEFKLLGSQKLGMTEQVKMRSEWCLVANIMAQPFGESHQIQKGTKHFSPNTKVYCSALHWGDGYEQIVVAGRHRGSSKLVLMVVPEKKLTNWRVQYVYLPRYIPGKWEILPWDSKERVEAFAKSLCLRQEARNARKQGFDKIDPSEALIYALFLRQVTDAQEAIERGADVNYIRYDGLTPLTVALDYEVYELLQLLLEHNVDLKTVSYQVIESVTGEPSRYPKHVVKVIEQAIDQLFPHSVGSLRLIANKFLQDPACKNHH